MKPILFPSTATEFNTQGLGVLTDAISCTVTEERNGAFELTMQYPDTGVHFDEITDRCIIYAIPSPYRAPQPFRIYRITRPMDGIIMVYAQHITYDLSGVPLNPFTAINVPDALSKLSLNAAVDSPFIFWTDKSTVASFAVSTPSSTRSVLGGSSGSILDVYGGEYEWDGFTVRLYGHRGYDNGVVISYGKNLTDIEQDRNISNVATGIYPYWTNAEGALVTCDPKIINAPGTYDFTRVVPVDFSNDFETQPTSEQLQARAGKYVEDNKIGIPKTSITASFVQLEQFPEYEDLALLEKCDLCDTVTIRYPQLGVEAKAEIVKIETDVLLERYNSVEIGDVRTNIADTIVGQQQEIKQKPSETYLREAVLALTETILGASGGAVRLLDTNNDGMPDTLYIADDPDPTKAHNVWRFNHEGWGASESGYNGPFSYGATLKNGMVADFITAGTLNADLVNIVNLISDHVVSRNGRFEMDLWAAVFKLMENDNLRARIYSTGQGAGGLVQVFSGTVTNEGGLGEDGAYSYLGPTGAGVGEKSDGSYTGTFSAGTLVVYNAVKTESGKTILSVVNGQRIGHFDRLAIGGNADFGVEWVWDAQLNRYVLCSNNS
ncbi:phage tail spike protein [Hominenteromicrobium sp.]|uniref:phage tail spike protein n=1 Tax=Hominenteromicrobium sp. TaxID=3073581 RepID=UPI003A8DF40E